MGEESLTARNLARVQEIYGRYAQGDRGALFEALAPGVSWNSVGDGLLPWAGSRKGPKGVRAYFAALDAEAEVTRYEVEQVIAQGEWIATLATVQIRYRRSEQSYRYAKADFIRLVDGQVVDFREFYDTAQACRDHACGG
ncbi:nuclear transport factor 2 family protein [Roseomonas sp. SSH11]|uniref:Nuclear transport factor 2 family protein n=1 Tax=Pararoseomonas baculiformis TaxID=2820812 RepID=A0ABS4ABW6_9PROT|nr:nuclear transport factor 2 family protein [Pararoseomonas baculiformis]MBP0444502.1 nuclear transport factor 2 family protein [Pararoseomonas baculiformis]